MRTLAGSKVSWSYGESHTDCVPPSSRTWPLSLALQSALLVQLSEQVLPFRGTEVAYKCTCSAFVTQNM